jgi:hypothetical protein
MVAAGAKYDFPGCHKKKTMITKKEKEANNIVKLNGGDDSIQMKCSPKYQTHKCCPAITVD